MDEQPLELECMNLDSVNETITETETTQNCTLNNDSINKMKVSELSEELTLRGLSKNGLKGVLVARLKEAVAEKYPTDIRKTTC